jgi:hypothetical protein
MLSNMRGISVYLDLRLWFCIGIDYARILRESQESRLATDG